MQRLVLFFTFVLVSATPALAAEQSLLARITVYWRGEGQLRACWNGARLQNGHCAVDPKKIPYGSKVVFSDAECLAVDTGPAIVSRRAARSCGRTASERNAIVIDRFFESRQAALSWEKAHPHFMTVRIRTPERNKAKMASATRPDPSLIARNDAHVSAPVLADNRDLGPAAPQNPTSRLARRRS